MSKACHCFHGDKGAIRLRSTVTGETRKLTIKGWDDLSSYRMVHGWNDTASLFGIMNPILPCCGLHSWQSFAPAHVLAIPAC